MVATKIQKSPPKKKEKKRSSAQNITENRLKNGRESFLKRLSKSKIYRDYEWAFTHGTGLPLMLGDPEGKILTRCNTNPFCALMAETNPTCAKCLAEQSKIEEEANLPSHSLGCFAGLCKTDVPVRVGNDMIAFLQTGQIFLHKPNKKIVNRSTREVINWGAKVDLKKLEEAYFNTIFLTKEQYKGMVCLLEIFAKHLGEIANQLLIEQKQEESPQIQKARQYIDAYAADPVTLDQVAKVVNMSTYYFCKMFKKATGLTFTEYLNRVRVEKAKNLLINPRWRISEVAFEVGFQSLSQFNRSFLKIVRQSPSEYRKNLNQYQ